MDVWVILTLILSFMMAFSIGSNDAANGLGTSYGTKAIPMRAIIFNGALAEFVGAMFCSDKVATTLSTDIIKDLTSLPEDFQKKMMFSVCLCSFVFIMTSSFSGMPISGTHTVVGALLGAGIIATGYDSLNWKQLGTILLSWFVSPLISAVISFSLMIMVSKLTMNTRSLSFRFRLLSQQFITQLSFMMLTYLIDKLINHKTISEPQSS
mmetsp:Transcript_3759/g.6415  ORF Transcript_3759/g.6415 Transcript_3759/m.6415 type:complete len:209 (+) Transcript_3759:27-653(+)